MATRLWLYGDGDPRLHHKQKIRVEGVSSRPKISSAELPTRPMWQSAPKARPVKITKPQP